MGIAQSVVASLRDRGFEAAHLLEVGMERCEDREILAKARAEGLVLLTHDLDFGDLLAAEGSDTPSVITFRLSNMKGANVIAHLLSAIDLLRSDLEAGAAITITDRKARSRLLPFNPPTRPGDRPP